mmetsp:Transcript_134515/g.374902  ORF Transcript_134515/g.374902 Transcript_134515/m.374902 type:complete len:253 (+) Transcript_134515:873-1631(+)
MTWLHIHLEVAALRRRGVRGSQVEGLDPQEQRGGDVAVVRRELEPTDEVSPHLRFCHLMEADRAFPARLDELLLGEAIYPFPEVVPVLPAEVRDVVAQLHLQMPRPPGVRLRETQHPGHGTQLLRRHVLEAQLLLKELAETKDLLETRELLAVHQFLLELLQLLRLICKLVVSLRNLFGALKHHLLPELCHLFLCLQLPGESRIVILLLEECRWHHARKDSQENWQGNLCKGHHDEEREGNQFQAIGCCADE